MRVIVLGTGTDVGKTYVTSLLAAGLARVHSVLALKPIESGVIDGTHGDAGAIARAAGHEPVLSPWRFAHPVSPHLAARLAGTAIELEDLLTWVEEQERHRPADITIIELAGGAFSPLAKAVSNADLALALGPALWLLVAPDALGVLHDVTATLGALTRRPDALVLSSARPVDASHGTNAAELEELGIAKPIEQISRGATGCPATVAWVSSHYQSMSTTI